VETNDVESYSPIHFLTKYGTSLEEKEEVLNPNRSRFKDILTYCRFIVKECVKYDE
jgi:hypothetical protein